MEYPLISEYRESILSAEENFKELSSLRPVLDSFGNPVMSSGNFAVVFKMEEETTGKYYAVKCFLKEQEGRDESYRKIAKELETVSSSYFLPLRYLEDELFVDSKQCSQEEFPVVVMEWVEGENLDDHIRHCIGNKYALEMLSYRFNVMASWLLAQPFAHGDLKPDNILIRKDGSLVLVDYDGMFVPGMKGEKAREIGSPDYRHPLRTDSDFNEHIDDFSIAVIALSLKAIALKPELKSSLTASDTLLLSEADFRDVAGSERLKEIQTLSSDPELSLLLGAFYIALAKNSLDQLSFRLFMTSKPKQARQTKPSVKRTVKRINTRVTEQDIKNGIRDEYGVLYSKDGSRLLKGNAELTEYTIRSGTKVICDGAFDKCNSLRSIVLPDSVISIGDYAFWLCKFLRDITIPDSVTSIGAGAFVGCVNLQLKLSFQQNFRFIDGMLLDKSGRLILCLNMQKEIVLPSSVTSIGDFVFWRSESLQSITLPGSVTSIGIGAFCWCESLQSITLSGSVTSIGNSAFCGCESLRSITLPDTVTSIGDCAFWLCKSLQNITLPGSVTSIAAGAFLDCKSLQGITIPDTVTSIGDRAFLWCQSLRSIVLPDTMISIGKDAFKYCSSLESITLPRSLGNIENCGIPKGCRIIRRK